MRPEVARPEVVRAEVVRAETVRPEVACAEVGHPERVRAEVARSELVCTVVVRPEVVRPEVVRVAPWDSFFFPNVLVKCYSLFFCHFFFSATEASLRCRSGYEGAQCYVLFEARPSCNSQEMNDLA